VEIRQIREETFRLVFRDGDLDASNGELADEFLRVLQQRCQQSIDWLEQLRDRSETEEMKGAITESINRHKVLLGTSKTLAGCYSVPRRTWADMDTIAAQADAIGDELFQNRNR
jgi:CRP-like cAMP-binding protein